MKMSKLSLANNYQYEISVHVLIHIAVTIIATGDIIAEC